MSVFIKLFIIFSIICYFFNVRCEDNTTEITISDSVDENATSPLSVFVNRQEHRPYVQLSAFDCSGLSSGPVLIIDKKTFYIPHLHYPNDELFSFGVENDDNLTLHSMEYNISSNRAENIYIRLPNIETISNYNYLSVAINDNKLCSVNIIKDNIPEEVSEDALFTNDYQRRITIRKCCTYLFVGTHCSQGESNFDLKTTIHEHNETHFNDTAINNAYVETFIENLECEENRSAMEYDQTEVKYLINGSLLLEYTFVSPRDFCFDNLHENGETKSIVIICMTLPVSTGFKYMLVIYQTCIGLSGLCLITISAIYLGFKQMRQTDRGKIVICFSITLFLQYVFLFAVSFSEGTACSFLGSLYQIFEISTFFWFATFQFDTYYMIRKNQNYRKTICKRWLSYVVLYGITLIFIITILAAGDIHPSLPQYLVVQECNIESGSLHVLHYQIPVLILLLIAAVMTALAFQRLWHIKKHETMSQKDFDMYNGMTCNGFIILITISLSWVAEIISFYIKDMEGSLLLILTVLPNLQGIIIIVILVYQKPLRNKICGKTDEPQQGEDVYLKTINNEKGDADFF